MHCYWLGGRLDGTTGALVRVEVQMARGLPGISLVGLAGAATRESRERVIGAIREGGFQAPQGRVTVNLAPAEEPKEGTALDLPMALGLLEASGQLSPRRGRDWWLLGELALDGQLLPVRGGLALGIAALRGGAEGIILPPENAAEAQLLHGIEVGILSSLQEAVAWVEGRAEFRQAGEIPVKMVSRPSRHGTLDLAEVEGLPRVRRALEIAAAGRHNILLIGSPGNGKSLMARILGDLLPPPDREELLEILTIQSVAGLPVDHHGTRPFRAPHHSVSVAGFLGSTARGGRPGEIPMAHGGLLFLDELPEFNRAVREGLREPMEDGAFVLSRRGGSVSWPADFQLVAAMNPCPCGQSLRGEEYCRCRPADIRRYFARISGPLLDRLDLLVEVPIWRPDGPGGGAESTADVRERVRGAAATLKRGPVVEITDGDTDWLDIQLETEGASYRLRKKVRAVSRTIAALDGRCLVRRSDMLEALEFTFLVRRRLESRLFQH
jgi:magnesium chelatase family protein